MAFNNLPDTFYWVFIQGRYEPVLFSHYLGDEGVFYRIGESLPQYANQYPDLEWIGFLEKNY